MKLKVLSFLPAATLSVCQLQAQATERPNIIVILADDMGYSDIGCFGSEIKTPNLDRLSSEGVRMTQFYNAARSCPSRAALLTGLYPHQVGVGDMLQPGDDLPAYQTQIDLNSVTLAEVLKSAGYSTFISGKWHVGWTEGSSPMDRGFEKQYGSSDNTTGHYFGIQKGRRFTVEGKDSVPPGEWITTNTTAYKLMKNEDGSQWYATDAYTDRAIKYINEQKATLADKPFFLYLAYTAPHWPLHAFESDIEKYKGKYMNGGWDSLRINRYNRMIEMGIVDKNWPLSERHNIVPAWNTLSEKEKIRWDHWMAVYAAMIDRMDQNIGRLLENLRQNGYDKNTKILFLSDNGGCHEPARKGDPNAVPGSPHSFEGYDYHWANASNTPFRQFKHWAHEGGISSPFIAWYPEKFKSGVISRQMAHITDIMPTLVDVANTSYPKQYKENTILPLEGQSLLPIFEGKKSKTRKVLYWEHEGNRAVRMGKWKLVSQYEDKTDTTYPWELYDIENDRSELNNLIEKHPGIARKMTKMYNKWSSKNQVVPYSELRKRRDAKQQK